MVVRDSIIAYLGWGMGGWVKGMEGWVYRIMVGMTCLWLSD